MKKTNSWATPRVAALLLLPALASCAGAGPEAPSPEAAAITAAMTITAADMRASVAALADDSARGRLMPSPELNKTADYLADRFRALGLRPAGDDGTYIQHFDYTVAKLDPEETGVEVEGDAASQLRYGQDYFMIPGGEREYIATAYYGGTAREGMELPADVRGRFVVINHPVAEIGQEWQQKLVGALRPALMDGVAGMIVILDPAIDAGQVQMLASMTAQQRLPFPVVAITDDAARKLFAAAGQDIDRVRAADAPTALGEATIAIRAARTEESFRPPNVVAVLPGSDPALAGTYVVLSAHFDHMGVGAPDANGDSIFNGADDDASGTAAILEIAKAFASMPEPPARSLLFLAVSGEEEGLIGSMAFAKNPTVPMDSIVADVNMDMIGRNAPDTVIGIGQEYSTLGDVLQHIPAAHADLLGLNVILDPEPEKMFFFRSDQLAFIQAGIPSVFFTTGEHPDYHKVTDDLAHLDTDKAARVARLAFFLTRHIANDPERPTWTPDGKKKVDQMLAGSPY